jgi:hypothetical protein
MPIFIAQFFSCYLTYVSVKYVFFYIEHGDIIWSIVSSKFDVACVCHMSLFVIFLSHDFFFVMPGLAPIHFTISFCFQISLRKSLEYAFLTNKLSNFSCNILIMHYFVFHFFFMNLVIFFLCAASFILVSHLIGLVFLQTLVFF